MKIRMRRDFNGLHAGQEYDVSDGDAGTLLAARVADQLEGTNRSGGDTLHGRTPSLTDRDSYSLEN